MNTIILATIIAFSRYHSRQTPQLASPDFGLRIGDVFGRHNRQYNRHIAKPIRQPVQRPIKTPRLHKVAKPKTAIVHESRIWRADMAPIERQRLYNRVEAMRLEMGGR